MNRLVLMAALFFVGIPSYTSIRAEEPVSYILTPKAPETPRINGPKIYGNKPGTPFLFKIPASGTRPMTFKAEGLPRGLELDENTGIIKGNVRRRGSWNVTLTATNAQGTCSRPFKIVIGDKICLTPPMGWNSWNCWRMTVSQEKVKSSVDALLEKGLDQYGWSYINIDDGWQLERGGKYGAILPNDKFPDMKALADYIHTKGLKFGIYSSPWAMCPGGSIGSSAINPEGRAWWIGEGLAGEYNLYTSPESDKKKYKNAWEGPRFHGDYLFMEADARQWSDWGVDLLKYDWHPNDYFSIKQMHDALASTNRSIAYSLSNRAPIGLGDVYVNMANAWRTSSDIHDLWYDIHRIGFTIMDRWAAYTGPGHWADADMLEIGDVADPSKPEGHTRKCRLTPAEQYTHFTLWAILCSPLLIGCDLASLDDFTLSLLTNSEVIDVNQDALGYPAARIAQEDSTVVYHKPLEDGSLAVALFNTSSKPQKMGFRVGELNYMMVETQTVRDLWRQKDIAVLHPGERFEGDAFETEVEPHGCRLLKLSPGLNYNQRKWWKNGTSDNFSLREKVGRMFFIRPEALVDTLGAEQVRHSERNPATTLTAEMISTYSRYPAGGFCLFSHNLKEPEQTREYISQLHSLPGRPLVCIDEEIGRVARIAGNPAFGIEKSPSAGEMVRSGSGKEGQNKKKTSVTEEARDAYRRIGMYLRDYGFDIDFAPVADVNTNPGNVVIGDRAFGSSPVQAGKMVSASVRGLSDAGVNGCLKHFPGHGDTREDTHLGSALTLKTWRQLKHCEMVPFTAGIRSGAGMVMVAHIGVPSITGNDRPATLSCEIMEGILRRKLGFNGVIITDAMEMGAISDHYEAGDAAIAAILAGADVILMPYGYKEAFDAVVKAVQDGIIPPARIERSVERLKKIAR